MEFYSWRGSGLEFIIILAIATLFIVFALVFLWFKSIRIDNIRYTVSSIGMTLVCITILIAAWFSIFIPATPYSNEENISRYKILIDKVEDIDENTPVAEIEKIYNEVAKWNEEYTKYQSSIGGLKNTRYPADRYVGCDEINFWEMIL